MSKGTKNLFKFIFKGRWGAAKLGAFMTIMRMGGFGKLKWDSYLGGCK